MNNLPLIDIDNHLGSLASEENVAMLLGALLRGIDADLARLKEALAECNAPAAARAGHALAGGAMAAGAPALAAAARDFENEARAGSMPDGQMLEEVCNATRDAAKARLGVPDRTGEPARGTGPTR